MEREVVGDESDMRKINGKEPMFGIDMCAEIEYGRFVLYFADCTKAAELKGNMAINIYKQVEINRNKPLVSKTK